MAVDTATKRSCALKVRTKCRRFLPVPDGTVAVADRAHVASVYYQTPAAAGTTQTNLLLLGAG
jgi:hypothetical protein